MNSMLVHFCSQSRNKAQTRESQSTAKWEWLEGETKAQWKEFSDYYQVLQDY